MQNTKYNKSLPLAERLAIIRAKAEYMKKDGSGYGYKYATIESVLGFIKPLLNEYRVGFSSQIDTGHVTRVTGQGKHANENLIQINMNFKFINLDDTSDMQSIPWTSFGQNSNEKGFGCAITYGTRYFLLNYFLIPTGDDDPDKYKAPAGTPAQIKAEQEAKAAEPIDLVKLQATLLNKGIKMAELEEEVGHTSEEWTQADRPKLMAAIKKLS
jgi:hypothetical protein